MKAVVETSLLAFAVTALGMLSADAATISLNNESFESPSLPSTEWFRAGTPPGWESVISGDIGVDQAGTVGNQRAYFNNSSGWSIIRQYSDHTIENAGEQIGLSAWVTTGNHDLDFNGIPTTVTFTLQLIFDDLFRTAVSTTQVAYSTSTDWTVVSIPTYTTTEADIGRTIGVYTGFMGNGNWSQGFLDGVSLTMIPEPTPAIFGALSLFGFLRRRRN